MVQRVHREVAHCESVRCDHGRDSTVEGGGVTPLQMTHNP